MDSYNAPPGGGASAPSAVDAKAAAETSRVPWELKGWSADKLGALSGAALAALCTARGLAKGGSLADKTARLLKWKKEEKKKNPSHKEKKEKRAREEEPGTGAVNVNSNIQLQVHIHTDGVGKVVEMPQEPQQKRLERHDSSGDHRDDYGIDASEGKRKMSFGKHKGKTFEEIFVSDPSYVQWITSQPLMNNMEMNSLQVYCKSRREAPKSKPGSRASSQTAAGKSGDILSVGKHKGKSFSTVLAEDRGYCEWAVRSDNLTGELASFAAFCKEHGVVDSKSSGNVASPKPAPAASRGSSQSQSGVIGGGKYKGKNFSTIMATDADYSSWLFDLPDSELKVPWMRDFKQFLVSQNFQPRH